MTDSEDAAPAIYEVQADHEAAYVHPTNISMGKTHQGLVSNEYSVKAIPYEISAQIIIFICPTAFIRLPATKNVNKSKELRQITATPINVFVAPRSSRNQLRKL